MIPIANNSANCSWLTVQWRTDEYIHTFTQSKRPIKNLAWILRIASRVTHQSYHIHSRCSHPDTFICVVCNLSIGRRRVSFEYRREMLRLVRSLTRKLIRWMDFAANHSFVVNQRRLFWFDLKLQSTQTTVKMHGYFNQNKWSKYRLTFTSTHYSFRLIRASDLISTSINSI